ncbi:atp-dependent protease atpase subunit [Plasmopara halstedii]|uniref:Atp-dependent protease atpase subunit n=1 Tax=Plasmopara halstedii TaxID=4781 RepID=A0A0P1AXB7_PLAHL|nr:atp-dependent protease atpase subunit [Plasmopara halstedii]CEG46414.1 atp-dependent protease atpase subunit [Plasmopara halstedii]|eukprot:XP_024582783.1 atp-dependent protease atpase subunit [Plasmopara halstedii]
MNLRRCAGVRRLSSIATDNSLVPADKIFSDGANRIPEDVVRELDKFIVGQHEAKKAVAVALRSRWRRQQLQNDALRAEISPMNILMSGPTGSGKTEIARRLAKISGSPFLKIEATKFTEVGVYGANANSMIKDLVDVAVNQERTKVQKIHAAAARERAIDRIVDLMDGKNLSDISRAKLREEISSGKAGNRKVRVHLKPISNKTRSMSSNSETMMEMPPELEKMMKHLDTLMTSRFSNSGSNSEDKMTSMTIKEVLPRFEAEESDKIIDEDKVVEKALENVQHNGIVFLDEIDKLANAGDQDRSGGNGVSYRKGEGVQKELLALTEGCAVNTRYGLVYTDNILFIASGAFHRSKPSDLMPELQGRLPIRVALSPLNAADFEKILKDTDHNLLVQTSALMETEGVKLTFTDDAIAEIASIAEQVNAQTDNIGARRLATVVNKITEDVSYHAPKMSGMAFEVDKKYVQQRLSNVLERTDLSKFIL